MVTKFDRTCSRACLKNRKKWSKEPNHDSSHINKSKKRFVQFIKSCSNSAKPFDLLKETRDEQNG